MAKLANYLYSSGFVDVVDRALHVVKPYIRSNIEGMGNQWAFPIDGQASFKSGPAGGSLGSHPVNCHSHNDYWREPPLYAALHAGCIGVEADVWLRNNELYVGHRRFSLRSNRTLQNLYVAPLLELLDKRNSRVPRSNTEEIHLNAHEIPAANGVFDNSPSQTFVLLIDFKSSGLARLALWEQLISELTPLRERGYLTHFNGTDVVERPVIVVGTGNAPFDQLIANKTYRDVFMDAPLDDIADSSSKWPNPNFAQDPTRDRGQNHIRGFSSEFNASESHPLPHSSNSSVSQETTSTSEKEKALEDKNVETYSQRNSYYASVSFTKSIGRIWGSRLSQEQLQLIRSQVRGAHQRGLKARYWGVPSWPKGLRNHIWHILMREGVDILNADELYDATQTDWRRQRSWAQ